MTNAVIPSGELHGNRPLETTIYFRVVILSSLRGRTIFRFLILKFLIAKLVLLIRIFGFALDTAPRQNANKFAFALGLFVIFGFALDTAPRQNANKFAFALGLFVSLHR